MTPFFVHWLVLAASFAPPPDADVAVVAAPAFHRALEPWVEHRQRQGHAVAVLDTDDDIQVIRRRLTEVADGGRLRFVLLVGDTPSKERRREWGGVPTQLYRARVNVHWGSEPELASDHPYADLDQDGRPELAVGRLPVDTPEEAAQLVARILAYEQAAGRRGEPEVAVEAEEGWRRRIELVAGVGGFGALEDSALEMVTKRLLTERVPAEFETRMTYASWRSPFCPDPRRFQSQVLESLGGGSLFWVYIGHGHRRRLDTVNTPVGGFPILSCEEAPKLVPRGMPPIAVFLACYTGAFDLEDDCLAETLLKQPGGPIAALCGSRVTMPYGMAVMAGGLMEEYFERRAATLGEAVLGAKLALLAAPGDDPGAELVEVLARTISPRPEELPAERGEHVLLFNLLGDPLLRLPHAERLGLQAATDGRAGENLTVRLTSPLAGRCVVELVARRDQAKHRLASRTHFEATATALAEYDTHHRLANDRVWGRWAVDVGGDATELEIPIPTEARGYCYLRAFIPVGGHGALGGREVFIRSPLAAE